MLTNREKLSAQAQKYIEKGQYDKAIREYLKIVEDDEKDVRTWLKIGDLFAKLGQKPEAAQTYQKVARFYSDQGFYLKAVAVYKQILRIDPRLVEVSIELAELYRQLGLVQDTISQYESIASFLQREGRSQEAVAAHRAILELDPNNVAQRIKLAELYSKEDLVGEAAREFAITADQLRAMGRVDDFLKVGERLLFHDPDNHAIAKELAALYIQREDPRRALTKLQACFKADPRDPETLDLLAQSFLMLRQHQKSVSVLKELARVYLEAGQPDQAAMAYQRILDIDPGDQEASAALQVDTLQQALGAQSEAAPAAPVLERERNASGAGGLGAEVELPRDADVARIVTEADVYAKYGLHGKALEHLRSALERQPASREIRERLYGLYELSGLPDEAVGELWMLVDQAATKEEAAGYLGEILRIQPHNRAAVLRWRRIQAQNGAFPPTEHAAPAAPVETAASAETAEDTEIALQEDLQEVDFFLRQNLRTEARALLENLLQRYPHDETLELRLKEVRASVQRERSGIHAGKEISSSSYEMTRQGLRLKGTVVSADSTSYFELALAYRDMGLYSDAITEFRKAMTDPRREVQCRTQIGLCYFEQNMLAEAIAELKRALYVNAIAEPELLDIYYYLGRSYEQIADRKESLYFYEKALKHKADFRDVRGRVARLRT